MKEAMREAIKDNLIGFFDHIARFITIIVLILAIQVSVFNYDVVVKRELIQIGKNAITVND